MFETRELCFIGYLNGEKQQRIEVEVILSIHIRSSHLKTNFANDHYKSKPIEKKLRVQLKNTENLSHEIGLKAPKLKIK